MLIVMMSQTSRLPTAGRFIRANRPKLRKLLSTGLDLRMNKSFKEYEITEDGVRAHFGDGSVYEGQFLIGCEGAASNGEFAIVLTIV